MRSTEKSCAFMVSDSKITLYGCCGVDKYSENEIAVRLCDIAVTVSGSDLDMSCYVCGEITVTGKIKCLSLDRKGGQDK